MSNHRLLAHHIEILGLEDLLQLVGQPAERGAAVEDLGR